MECTKDKSFEFVIKNESRISTISTLQQLRRLPLIENPRFTPFYLIDFEKCVHLGIDAIELCWYGDEYADTTSGNLHFELYGWDCDSMVVLNPDAVIPK